jgi:hypothetical protein
MTGYVQAIEHRVYTIPQSVEIVSESATTALVDGGNGLGFVAAHRAMELSITKARQQGVGMATVRNGHHIGMVGYYPLMAVAQDMIGMAVTQGTSLHNQELLTGEAFPDGQLRQKQAEGKYLTHLIYADPLWVAVVSAGANLTEQLWIR